MTKNSNLVDTTQFIPQAVSQPTISSFAQPITQQPPLGPQFLPQNTEQQFLQQLQSQVEPSTPQSAFSIGSVPPGTGRSTASFESSGKFNPTVYKDSKGLDTVGIGHLVTDADRASGRFNKPLTRQQEQDLFQEDKSKITDRFYKSNPQYIEYNASTRQGLEDLAFNMGPDFLDKFPNMKAALDKKDFATAAKELVTGSAPGSKSQYVKDVNEERAYTNASRIANGLR